MSQSVDPYAKSFRLVYHRGTPGWRVPSHVLEQLNDFYAPLKGKGVNVHVWPRSEQAELTPDVRSPYAYRAVTRGTETHLLVDETETPESLGWLLAHELGHQLLRISPTVKAALAEGRPTDPGIHPADDRFHQLDPEERLVDGFATRVIGERLDREWWRERTPVSFGSHEARPSRYGRCC